eukprot:758417-Hanusia_phi.AAC.4
MSRMNGDWGGLTRERRAAEEEERGEERIRAENRREERRGEKGWSGKRRATSERWEEGAFEVLQQQRLTDGPFKTRRVDQRSTSLGAGKVMAAERDVNKLRQVHDTQIVAANASTRFRRKDARVKLQATAMLLKVVRRARFTHVNQQNIVESSILLSCSGLLRVCALAGS